MPRHCSAGGCKSRDNRGTRNAGITFHKLPKGAPRRNLWISNSHRADSWDPQTDFVYFCSKHFTPRSFELTGCSGIRRLKEDAYPTIFDLSLGVKGKRATTHQKQDVRDPVSRKKSCSWEQDTETAQGHTMEKASTQSATAAPKDSNETPVLFQDSSCVTRLSQQEHIPSSASRPCSPSHYMRRLPPPPGFYLSNEHSYAQLCPLLWKRRYDQVVACLEKALQQLHAAKRRESRLRSTVLRLRDKGPKLPLSQQGCKDRTGWKLGGQARRPRATCDPQEVEPESPSLEDRCSDPMEVDNCFLPKSSNWSSEVKRYCFFCGRGQVQIVWEAECRGSETWTDVLPTHQEDSLQLQRSSETITFSLVGPDGPSGTILENSVTDAAAHQVQIQNLDLQQWTGTHEQGEAGRSGPEQQLVFWTEDSKVDQFLLVPVHTKKGLQTFRVTEPVLNEPQTQLDPNVRVQHMTEDSGSLSRYESAGVDENKHCVVAAPLVEMREDVREKLKEHLEGFHLQLSTQFKS